MVVGATVRSDTGVSCCTTAYSVVVLPCRGQGASVDGSSCSSWRSATFLLRTYLEPWVRYKCSPPAWPQQRFRLGHAWAVSSAARIPSRWPMSRDMYAGYLSRRAVLGFRLFGGILRASARQGLALGRSAGRVGAWQKEGSKCSLFLLSRPERYSS